MYKTDEVINKFKLVHGDKYDYSKTDFIKTTVKVCIICPEHGEFWQEPHAHLKGQGCPKCGLKQRITSKTNTLEEFIDKSNKIHYNYYDYSKVNYINNKEKISIVCPEHGDFMIQPGAHLQGRGCPRCGTSKKGTYKKLNTESFINKAMAIHGDNYDYSEVEYTGYKNPVKIYCKKHGYFLQAPEIHLMGSTCPECAKERRAEFHTLSKDEFIERALNMHGTKYDYSKVEYINCFTPITIICPEHGEFIQKPYIHLSGCGCQKCGMLYSHYEVELGDFISDIIGEENIIRNDRDTLNGIELDIHIPSMKLAFEFNGLYWHSELNGKDKWYHINKLNECNKKGIKLIQIFEDEYLTNRDLIYKKLDHILKIPRICPKIMGRKCIIREIDNEAAKDFLNKNHIQGYSNSTISYGAYFQGIIIGVMCFTKTGKKDIWILNRFATDNKYICQGIGGKLFKHFIKIFNPLNVKSFADRRWTLNSEDNLYISLG